MPLFFCLRFSHMHLTKIASVAAVMGCLALGASFTISPSFAQSSASAEETQADRAEAQRAFAEGRKEDALALINKVVISNPADLSARFFRAQILVSLGRGAEIRDELELMATLNLPAEDKKRALDLVRVIDKQGSRLSGKASIKLSYGFTDNVNSWPNKGNYTHSNGLDYPLTDSVYEKNKKVDDTIVDGTVSVFGTYDITEARDLKTNFSFSGNMKDGSDTVHADRKYFVGKIGLQQDFSTGMSVKANVGHSILDRVNRHNEAAVNSDVDTTTYDAEISQKIGKMTAGLKYSNAKADASKVANADRSDATTQTASVYLGAPIGKTMFVRGTASFAKTRSDANTDLVESKKRSDKDKPNLSLVMVKVLEGNHRLLATASLGNIKYKSAMAGPTDKRKDSTRAFSLSYTFEAKELTSYLDGYEFGVMGSYYKSDSNQSSADVEVKSLNFSLSRKFELF